MESNSSGTDRETALKVLGNVMQHALAAKFNAMETHSGFSHGPHLLRDWIIPITELFRIRTRIASSQAIENSVMSSCGNFRGAGWGLFLPRRFHCGNLRYLGSKGPLA